MRRVEFKRGPKEEEAWLKTLGNTAWERTERLGGEVLQFRKSVGLPPPNADKQASFNAYIHDIGGSLLATKVDDDAEEANKRERLIRKQTRLAKLLKKKVKVTDFEDGGLSVAIDREWDTSSW